MRLILHTYETDFILLLLVQEHCLAPGLRQLTQDTKSDVICLQRSETGTKKKRCWNWPSHNINCEQLKELMKILLYKTNGNIVI